MCIRWVRITSHEIEFDKISWLGALVSEFADIFCVSWDDVRPPLARPSNIGNDIEVDVGFYTENLMNVERIPWYVASRNNFKGKITYHLDGSCCLFSCLYG